jgi:hypothetical protein
MSITVSVRALNEIEEHRGPDVDSYDKLIAWMMEMAETDNVPIDSSMFINQFSGVCDKARSSSSSASSKNTRG